MMKIALLLLVLSIPVTAQITSRYDKFKDATIVSFNDGYVHGKEGRRIKFYAYYIDQQGQRNYYFRFINENPTRLAFQDHRNLIFLFDGERVVFDPGSYTVDSDKYRLKEAMTFSATKGDMERLASGKVVQFQLGTFEAELSEKQKQGVKELLEHGK